MTKPKNRCVRCKQPCPVGTTVCIPCVRQAEAQALDMEPEDMELCEHGLSAALCGGPQHWYDHP